MTKKEFKEIIEMVEKHELYYEKLDKLMPIDVCSDKFVPWDSFGKLLDMCLSMAFTEEGADRVNYVLWEVCDGRASDRVDELWDEVKMYIKIDK